MPTVTTISGHSTPPPPDQPWTTILWREWRNTDDDVHAEHLFSLLVRQPLSRQALVGLVGLGAGAGALIGWLYSLWITHGDVSNNQQALTATVGLVLGGLLPGLVTLIPPRVRYGHLLNALTPMTFDSEHPLPGKFPSFTQRLPFGVGLGLLLSVEIILALLANRFDVFYGQTRVLIFSLLTVGLLLFFRPHPNFFLLLRQVIRGVGSGLLFMLGVMFILSLFGVGFGAAPWHTQTLLLLSWLLGGLLGWQVWGRAGLILGLLWAGGLLLVAAGSELARLDVIWLLAMLLAGFGRSLSRLWPRLSNLLSFGRAYPYRRWYFWWAKPPLLTEVAQALRSQATEDPWPTTLQQLEAELEHLKSPTVLIEALSSRNWVERFVAPHVLVRLGSEPVEPLLALVNQAGPSLQRTACRILDTISADTTRRLGPQAAHLLCIDCLTFCAEYTEQVAKKSLTYYGCRTCGQSWEFLLVPRQTVIAVLDAGWAEPYEETGDALRVNYLQRGHLFDFTAVEIWQAEDEQIERFAVRVGNDTDPRRRERYAAMRCLVSGAISPNSLRILERTFGEVVG